MSFTTRKSSEVYLIGVPGTVAARFPKNKLPLTREVLQVFYHHHITLKQGVRASARLAVRSVVPFWTVMSRIPIIQEIRGIEKIETLYGELLKLKKNSRRRITRQLQNEVQFKEKLDKLFDIATVNALEVMHYDEDKAFLEMQRRPGRPGSISASKDLKLALLEREEAAKSARRAERKRRYDEYRKNSELKRKQEGNEDILILGSDDVSETDSVDDKQMGSSSKRQRGRKNLITPQIALTCDALGISARGAAKVLAVTMSSTGQNINDYNVNYSSVYRQRTYQRQRRALSIKQKFKPDPCLTLHWDGKIVPDLTSKRNVDRIAIVVTGVTSDQLLKIPKLTGTASGRATAEIVYDCVEEWRLENKIKAFSFDTTSVNTGSKNGAAVILKDKLQHDVLYLACRHHVLEIILEAVFEHNLKPVGGPEISLFKRFQQEWPVMDKHNVQAFSDEHIAKYFSGDASNKIVDFTLNKIAVGQPRDDYLELLNLSLVILRRRPPEGMKIRAPGAFHRARWMAKAIYSLKIWIFRYQFILSESESKGLLAVTVFILKVYIFSWYTATDAPGAPKNDLKLITRLKEFRNLDSATASIALKKFSRHLWYLSEQLSALSFFDDSVSPYEKKKMVYNLKNKEGVPNPSKRLPRNLEFTNRLALADFVSTNSLSFFRLLSIPEDFLEEDPVTWHNNSDYKISQGKVKALRVTNDHAERAIKLMENFNKTITYKEDSFQHLLLGAAHFQRTMNDSRKSIVNEQCRLDL